MTQNIGTEGQSFKGYCGITEESSYGGGGAPSAFLPIRSDGFSAANNPMFDSNIRGRNRFTAAAGAFDDDGDVELVAGPENGLGYLLKGALGQAGVTSPNASTGVHTFDVDDFLPSFSVEIGLGSIDAARHVGVGVDSLELSHTPDEFLIVTAGMTAKEYQLQGAQATPSYTDLRPFVWHDGTITVDGSDRTADIDEFEVSIENNIDEKIRGERTPTKAHVGEPVVSGSMDLDFENTDVAKLFLGGSAASSPQDALYKAAVNATWTSPEATGGGSNYELEADMPAVSLSTHESTLNEQDAIVENVEYEAEVDAGTGYELQMILTNGQTAAY